MSVDKLVDSAQLDADLASVAAAIRTKGGTSAQLAFPAGFVSAIQAIPTGGGGASNFVTGTFKGTTTGAAMDVTLNYTGSGYPIAIAVYPKDGYQSGSSAYALLQRYAVMHLTGVKRELTAPTYENSGSQNQFVVYTSNKSSASTASSLTGGGSLVRATLQGSAASGAGSTNVLTFIDSKTMSVFIASTSYGFAANIEYAYLVLYSS